MRMRLLRDSTLLEWRAVANDGMLLPTDQAIVGPSAIQMGNGETYDFEFVPSAAEDLRLDGTSANSMLLVSMPIACDRELSALAAAAVPLPEIICYTADSAF